MTANTVSILRTRRWRLLTVVVAMTLLAAACSNDDPVAERDDPTPTDAPDEPTDGDGDDDTTTEAPPVPDRAFYVLPPGNYGGIPTTEQSFDQLPLYDGLTPRRGEVSDADLEEFFLPQDFSPVGETTEEPTPNDGVRILYDEFGVAHVTGETREDVAYGAGWVTGRDRNLLVELGRSAARAAVADIPGLDAFEVLLTGQTYVPSEAVEQLVTDQVELIREVYGDEGEEIIADAEAYAAGMTAYWEANDIDQTPANVNDVVAVTAFIGSIFGAGGGNEAGNAEYLSRLQNELGEDLGRQVWEDFMYFDDPEAPTTIEERFDYPVLTGGEVTGSVIIDEGSIESLDPLQSDEPETDDAEATPEDGGDGEGEEALGFYPAAGPVPDRRASNWLTVAPEASENGTPLAVMGPQLGYYYPEIVQQIHLSGPGIEAQGAAVPGLAMYILIGRTEDYAWSLTSASQDVRDVFAEVLCEPDGSEPTRDSQHYEHDGECIPFETFDAGTLNGTPIVYPTSVHGPVIGTATTEGQPVALTRQRSTFGRDGLNLGALKDMTEGDADTPEAFWETANQFGFTFNWGYANRDGIAYFASGYLPERAEGLDRRLPTLGTGEYEWQGFLDLEEHPHADGHPSGRLLNWNNQSAPGFMHGDTNPYGSVHRVELFDQWPDQVDLAGVVSIMNRSATEDVLSPVWPVIRAALEAGEAPSQEAAEAIDLIDAWIADDAPRLDADDDGFYDEPGPLVMDRLFDPLVVAVVEPVLGDLAEDINGISEASVVDKDLRTLLGEDVEGPFNVQYCGAGDLDDCTAALWAAVDDVVADLIDEFGADTSTWLREGARTSFAPGLIPDVTFRSTNRPTFQQVLEFGTE